MNELKRKEYDDDLAIVKEKQLQEIREEEEKEKELQNLPEKEKNQKMTEFKEQRNRMRKVAMVTWDQRKQKDLEVEKLLDEAKALADKEREQGITAENNEWTKRKQDVDRKLKSIKDKELDVFVPNYIRNAYDDWNNDVDWPSTSYGQHTLGQTSSVNSGGGVTAATSKDISDMGNG